MATINLSLLPAPTVVEVLDYETLWQNVRLR
jgi:phage-related baseplate assembly protein